MKELSKHAFELFRRHIVLWVPCSVAAIMVFALDRLQKVEIHALVRFFSTRRSVLGGEAPVTDWGQIQHRTMLVGIPVGTLKTYFEICLFVAALIVTKELVRMVLSEHEPEIGEAVRGLAPRYREVLLFSLKYIVAAVLFVAFPLFLASLLPSERIREIALSKTFLICFGLIAEGCIAWLLLPAAIRMLRSPRSLAVSVQDRQLGTIYVVATALASFALEYLIGEIEAKFTYRGAGQSWAIALLNTVLINAPQVLLFIVLSLLAIRDSSEESRVFAEPKPN
jgi:hypothetical protein